MSLRHLHIAFLSVFLCMLMPPAAFTQDCPVWGNKETALKFLIANKAHGTNAGPRCVNRAFSALAHDKSSAEALVDLLDFERSIEKDDFKTRGGQYPAIGALMSIGKSIMPYLIKAIKENDSELVRTNAAEAVGAIHRPCVRDAMHMLRDEATKPEASSDQQRRLLAAEEYIGNSYSLCKSEESLN